MLEDHRDTECAYTCSAQPGMCQCPFFSGCSCLDVVSLPVAITGSLSLPVALSLKHWPSSGYSGRKTVTKEVVVKAEMFLFSWKKFKLFRNLKPAAIWCLYIFDWWVKMWCYNILQCACGWSSIVRKMYFLQPEPAFLECHGWLAVLWVGKFYSLRQLCDLACFSQQIHSSSCRHLLKSFSFLP